jgi:hypothetical protein
MHRVILVIWSAATLHTVPALAQTDNSEPRIRTESRSQVVTPANENATTDTTDRKLRRSQRDSAAPANSGRTTSGVRARQDLRSMSPDMSYHTIVNDPSGKEVRTTPQIGGQGATADRPVAVPGPSSTTVPQSADNRGATETAPESMQIQQETLKKNPPPAELITKGGAPASQGTPTVNSPLETNRIDPASPSRQRLQIDDTAAVRPQDPGAPSSLTPNEGASTGAFGSASPTRGSMSAPISPSAHSGATSHSSGSSSSSSH